MGCTAVRPSSVVTRSGVRAPGPSRLWFGGTPGFEFWLEGSTFWPRHRVSYRYVYAGDVPVLEDSEMCGIAGSVGLKFGYF